MSWRRQVLQSVLLGVAALLAIGYGLTLDDRVSRWAAVVGGGVMLAGVVAVVLRDNRRPR